MPGSALLWSRHQPERQSQPRNAFRRLRDDPLGLFAELAELDPDLAHCRLGRRDFFLVIHPDLIQRVLVSETDRYVREEYALKGWSRRPRFQLSPGFLPSEQPERHLRARRLYAPAFRRARLNETWELLAEVTDQALDAWERERNVEAYGEIRMLTAQFLAAAMFATQPGLAARELIANVRTCLSTIENATSRSRRAASHAQIRSRLATVRAYEELTKTVTDVIEFRRRRPLDGDDALGLLLRGAGELDDLSEQDVLFETLGFLFAGIETTAAGIAWVLSFLGQQPVLQARVRDELGECPGAPSEDTCPLTYAVFKESLRLYPPSWRMPRTAVVEHELGGRTIAPGSHVWVSQHVVHRDRRWYANPNEFRPERWLDGSLDGNPKLAFLPFGAGPRKCLGEELAWRELAAVTAGVLRRFEFSADAIEPMIDFVIQPAGYRLPLRLSARMAAVAAA